MLVLKLGGVPQKQNIVPLVLFRRAPEQAMATGNNAAWTCVCRRALPLVGRSGSVEGVSQTSRVDCPDCGRRYFVVPDGPDGGGVLEVREV